MPTIMKMRGGERRYVFKEEVRISGKHFHLPGGMFIWVGTFFRNFKEGGVVLLFG